MKPEAQARQKIDQLLTDAGWQVQDYEQINLSAGLGIAVREYHLNSGFADYLLFINRKAVGIIEAKPVGFALSGVEIQSDKYSFNLPKTLSCHQKPLPFIYESTGGETYFRDSRDPDYRCILKQAFEGKLVPQDPNDEPAEKLLERIKVEKAKQTTTKTKKKTQSKKQSDFQLEIPLK